MATGIDNGPGLGWPEPRPERPRFRRFDPYRPDCNFGIEIFPHGFNKQLPQQIDVIGRQMGLRRQYVWNSPGPDRSVRGITRVDPWNSAIAIDPLGYYPGATGTTFFGGMCLMVPAHGGRLLPGHLELTYVTWRFVETSDFSSSIGIKAVPRSHDHSREYYGLADAAAELLERISATLTNIPPSPISVSRRRRRSV